MQNCIFCKIVNNEIKSYSIYEDEKFKVILDAFPSALGHVLIIPKEHIENIYELNEELGGELFKIAIKLSKSLKKSYNLSGLNLVQNNGEVAGQKVMHFHIHLIPRQTEDQINFSWQPISLLEDDFANAVINIKNNLN